MTLVSKLIFDSCPIRYSRYDWPQYSGLGKVHGCRLVPAAQTHEQCRRQWELQCFLRMESWKAVVCSEVRELGCRWCGRDMILVEGTACLSSALSLLVLGFGGFCFGIREAAVRAYDAPHPWEWKSDGESEKQYEGDLGHLVTCSKVPGCCVS